MAGRLRRNTCLTSDIARELIEKGCQVEVEYLNRKIANGMTIRRSRPAPEKFGSKRTDVAVLSYGLFPLAIIEVKIGVTTFRGIYRDLVKITDTIDALKAQFACAVWGAAVFQVHIAGSTARHKAKHFRSSIEKAEAKIKSNLLDHSKTHSGYRFGFHGLQGDHEGYTPRALEPLAWGQHGHATRYYAVLIKSKKTKPKRPKTIKEMKAYMQG
jgi:hypothetical protein